MFLKAVLEFFAPKRRTAKRNDDDPLAYHAYNESDPLTDDEEENVEMPRIKERQVFATQQEANMAFVQRYYEYLVKWSGGIVPQKEEDFYWNLLFITRDEKKLWLVPANHPLHEFLYGINKIRRKRNQQQQLMLPEADFMIAGARIVVYADEFVEMAVDSILNMAEEYGFLRQEREGIQ